MSQTKDRLKSGSLKGCYFYNYHSHQPYLVEGGQVIGNLRKMWRHGSDKDQYEARMFYQCYLNPAQRIMSAHEQGKKYASCMADFSGTLLEGLLDMEREGFFANEGKPAFTATWREALRRHPENLELTLIPWSHPYLDGGCPPRDFDRQIGRGLELYGAVFGEEVRARVKGLFPPEMGLPKDPDALYALVAACRKNGLKWMLVNETSLEGVDGAPVSSGYPYVLHVKNREGAEVNIPVLTRTHNIYQSEGGGHAAAKSNLYSRLNQTSDQLMVGSAGDLENGGVMMNEHWGPWQDTVGDGDNDPVCSATGTVFLEAMLEKKLGVCDWDRAAEVFRHVRSLGGSWTYGSAHWTEGQNKRALDNISETLSAFHEQLSQKAGAPHPQDGKIAEAWYASERAMFITETSCYRYWGDSGDWMNAGFALVNSAVQAANHFAEIIGASGRLRIDSGKVVAG